MINTAVAAILVIVLNGIFYHFCIIYTTLQFYYFTLFTMITLVIEQRSDILLVVSDLLISS